jgi:hypothetical protein
MRSTHLVGATATREVLLPSRASRSVLETWSGVRLSVPGLAPLGADPRRLHTFREPPALTLTVWTSLLGLAASSVTRVQAGSVLRDVSRIQSASRGFPSPSTLQVDRVHRRRLATTDCGAAHAVSHGFSDLLLVRPFRDVSPGNALGVPVGLQGFPLTRVGRRHRLPPLVTFTSLASRDASLRAPSGE